MAQEKKKGSCSLSNVRTTHHLFQFLYAYKAIYKKKRHISVVHKIFLPPTSVCLPQTMHTLFLMSGVFV